MSFRFSPKIVTNGLVFMLDAANHRSYPGTGTTWTNLVGDNNGTLVNGPTFDSENGGSIVFDGINDKVSTTFNANFFPLSICCWVNFDTISFTGGAHSIVDQSPGSQGFGFRMANIANNGDIEAFYYNTSGVTNLKDVISNSLLSANTWHYVCVTYSATQMKGYADGNLSLSPSVSLTNPKFSTDDTRLLAVAGSPDDSDFSTFLDGKISNVKIYNRTLSGEEITQNYNAFKSRFNLYL